MERESDALPTYEEALSAHPIPIASAPPAHLPHQSTTAPFSFSPPASYSVWYPEESGVSTTFEIPGRYPIQEYSHSSWPSQPHFAQQSQPYPARPAQYKQQIYPNQPPAELIQPTVIAASPATHFPTVPDHSSNYRSRRRPLTQTKKVLAGVFIVFWIVVFLSLLDSNSDADDENNNH